LAAIAALVAPAAGAGIAPAATTQEQTNIGIALCPNVTETTSRFPPDIGQNHGCTSFTAMTSNSSASAPLELGAFCTSQNPIGAWVNVAGSFGEGVRDADVTATIGGASATVNNGPSGIIQFPVGSFAVGTYRVVASFPGKTVTQPNGNTVVYSPSSAYGTVHVVLGSAASGRCQAGAKLPPGTPPAGSATGTVLVNGAPYTGGTIQYGSSVDVTKGRLVATTEVGTITVFGGGAPSKVKLLRAATKKRTLVELRLIGGNFSACGARAEAVAAKRKKKIRLVWATGKGRFRTAARYSTASVHGTFWLTEDRCDGSLTQVKEGVVSVYDKVKKKTVSVRAGRRYFAGPPR
jgi:hypothetical protein